MTLNVMGLFAGIGGMELGLQRAGMNIVALVERDAWCRSVLGRHWPDAAVHDDVATTVGWWADRARVDVVSGGFPCQPFSTGGLKKGMDDERWMWPAMVDAIRTVRPRYVVVENVSALIGDSDAWGTVLSDLHNLGFDAEWATLQAAHVGAPHRRKRVYLVAYPAGDNGEDADNSWAEPAIGIEPGRSGWEHARGHWVSEPAMGRVAHGVPRRMVYDELHALGNAVVPQVFEHIGRQIMNHAEAVAA